MAASKLVLVLLAACVLQQALSAPSNEPRVRRNMIRGRPRDGMKKTPPLSSVSHLINFDQVVSSTFTQTLDHFDSSVGKTFKQRYWHNNQWYKPGGPAFLMLGGEGPESSYWVSYPGLEITNLAAQQGAWVFDIEHRFYGDTIPTADMSVKNLKYLSSAQAIEDAAAFIKAMTAQYPQLANAKWVTFGGSYSGALAAWTRAKHPELVYAAVGSSGPVQAEVDFVEYLEVVKNSISRNSTECADSVTAGFNLVASLLQTADGRKQLKTAFHLCQDIQLDDKSLKYFWETVYSPYMEVVQYSGDAAGQFATQLTISHAICRYHINSKSTTIQKMKQVNDYFNLVNEYFGCNDIDYNGFISFMKDETFGEAQSDRAWVWQTCTEFGYYQSTASSTAGPWFGGVSNLPAQYYIDECTAIYGAAYNSQEVQNAVSYTNQYYGGRDNLNTARILLPNGDIDPWHALGKLTSTNNTDIVPVVINGTAHCADMYGASSLDSIYLTNARQTIAATLNKWLTAA